jgi:hypothetical protein
MIRRRGPILPLHRPVDLPSESIRLPRPIVDAYHEAGYNAVQGQLSTFEGLVFVDGRRPLVA